MLGHEILHHRCPCLGETELGVEQDVSEHSSPAPLLSEIDQPQKIVASAQCPGLCAPDALPVQRGVLHDDSRAHHRGGRTRAEDFLCRRVISIPTLTLREVLSHLNHADLIDGVAMHFRPLQHPQGADGAVEVDLVAGHGVKDILGRAKA